MKRLHSIKMNNYEAIDAYVRLNSTFENYYLNGHLNSQFYKYDAAYRASSTNRSIIDKYVKFIVGKGLVDENGYDISKIFGFDDLELFVLDYVKSANTALQTIYNFKGEISNLYHLPIRCIGVNKEEDIMDDVSAYWYCFDWRQRSVYQPEQFPGFAKGEPIIVNDIPVKPTEIFFLRGLDDSPLFSEPSYLPCLQYCFTDEQVSNFINKHIRKSFSVKTIINVNNGDKYSDDQIDELIRTYKSELTGTDGEEMLVSINNGIETATTVETIDIPDAYQQYQFVVQQCKNEIMQAHGVTNPALFGVIAPSGFSSQAEDKQVSKLDLFDEVIQPMRNRIIYALNKLLSVNSPNISLKFIDQLDEVTKVDNGGNVTTQVIDEKNNNIQ